MNKKEILAKARIKTIPAIVYAALVTLFIWIINKPPLLSHLYLRFFILYFVIEKLLHYKITKNGIYVGNGITNHHVISFNEIKSVKVQNGLLGKKIIIQRKEKYKTFFKRDIILRDFSKPNEFAKIIKAKLHKPK